MLNKNKNKGLKTMENLNLIQMILDLFISHLFSSVIIYKIVVSIYQKITNFDLTLGDI